MSTRPPDANEPADSIRQQRDSDFEKEYQQRLAEEDPTEWEPKRRQDLPPLDVYPNEQEPPLGRRKRWYKRPLFWIPGVIVVFLGASLIRGYALASEFSACLVDETIQDQVSQELQPEWQQTIEQRWGVTEDNVSEAIDAMSEQEFAEFNEYMFGGGLIALAEARKQEICLQNTCTDTLSLSSYAPGRWLHRTLHPDAAHCP